MDDVVPSHSLTEEYLADLNEVSEKAGLEVRTLNEGYWTLYLLRAPNTYVVKRREGNPVFRRWEKLAYVYPEPIEGVWKLEVRKSHEKAIRRVADRMISRGYEMVLVV